MKNFKNFFAVFFLTVFLIALSSCSETTTDNQNKELDGPKYINPNYPSDRYYTTNHEWVKIETSNLAIVGITNYPLNIIGTCSAVENDPVKKPIHIPHRVYELTGLNGNADVYMPVAGSIDEFNTGLETNPGVINIDPYNLGWLFRITEFDSLDIQGLMNSAEYQEYLDSL